jgi:hypothetical protein
VFCKQEEHIMRINFRSLVLASAAIAATAIATVPAQAATVGAATLNVPFSFTVDGQSLPAGNYLVQRENNGNFIKFESENGAQTFNWVARATGDSKTSVTLRFDERGQSHALQSIQYGPLTTPRLDRKVSARERESEQVVSGQ